MYLKQAMRATANLIEKQPERYEFYAARIPESLKKSGCLLGWIGFFMQAKEKGIYGTSRELLGVEEHEFYNRLDRFHTEWIFDAKIAADALRRYIKEFL